MLNKAQCYCVLHKDGLYYWSRAYTEIPTTPDHKCIHIATYTRTP